MPLEAAPAPWHQLSITFTKPHEAEHHLRTVLGPALRAAENDHLITAWFFIRKTPWRLRYLPADAASQSEATAWLHRAADELHDSGAARWASTIYEPETHAFGGPEGMQTAHQLFHVDSRAVLSHLTAHAGGSDDRGGSAKRRELSVLLCAALMRAAGLDRYEQGDVWAQVAAHRPHTDPGCARLGTNFVAAVQRLTTVDTATGTPLRAGALAFADDWLTAFEHTGRQLRALAEDGRLTRGVRAVIAHHVIFHWNRLGLAYATQSALAHAAKDAAFADPRHAPPVTAARTATTRGERS